MIAAAPDMADVLEAVEWAGLYVPDPDGKPEPACPLCDREEELGHASDCALHAALVAAGRRG